MGYSRGIRVGMYSERQNALGRMRLLDLGEGRPCLVNVAKDLLSAIALCGSSATLSVAR